MRFFLRSSINSSISASLSSKLLQTGSEKTNSKFSKFEGVGAQCFDTTVTHLLLLSNPGIV